MKLPDEPALTLPFHLRGYDGTVRVFYAANSAPERWGLGLLNLPFPIERTRGFPVIQAAITYAGPGYHAMMGWIQIVTVRDAASGQSSASLDLFPIQEPHETPFAPFGMTPTLFDAPGPNPPRTDETWIAETFLAICPDVARTRHVVALLGMRWGYELRAGEATSLPVEVLDASAWDTHLPLLRREYPRWTFDAGFQG